METLKRLVLVLLTEIGNIYAELLLSQSFLNAVIECLVFSHGNTEIREC